MTHEYRILIGANGWIHPAWQEDFYPDELPDGWLLGYYSNEFPVVLISAEQWPGLKGDISDYLEDSNEGMRIVCEIPAVMTHAEISESIGAINEFIEELRVMGDQLLAIILPVSGEQPELEKLVKGINSPVPVCLELSRGSNDSQLQAVRRRCEQNHWPLVWKGEEDAAGLGYGEIAIARIATSGMDLRQLRVVVETMLQKTTLEQSCILIIEGDPPDIATIRNANVILDLF